MSRPTDVPCWVDGIRFDTMKIAAETELGISASVLCRAHLKHTRFQVLDEFEHLRTVDFLSPAFAEPPKAPPPPHPRRSGEPLLSGHVKHRLGVYR